MKNKEEELKTLKEKRKEVDRMLVQTGLDMLTIKRIHNKIRNHDKEFIRLLKASPDFDDEDKAFIDKLSGFKEEDLKNENKI